MNCLSHALINVKITKKTVFQKFIDKRSKKDTFEFGMVAGIITLSCVLGIGFCCGYLWYRKLREDGFVLFAAEFFAELTLIICFLITTVYLKSHEFDKNINFTGIVWNDGRGNFPKQNKTFLPQYKKKWGTVPEVSAADLDNDGDLDIVYSRAG